MKTIQQRLDYLYTGKTLSLAIEGKDTNLQIWIGVDGAGRHEPNKSDTVFMRIDKYNEYSVPLSEVSIAIQDKTSPVLQLTKFGFKSPIKGLKEILEITLKMKYRKSKPW